jgi:transcriptional regulator with XRE-family HTH domain
MNTRKPYQRGTMAPQLLHWRTQAGLTQEELARLASCGVATIRRIEADHRTNYATLEKIASALSGTLQKPVTRQMLMRTKNK